MKAESKERTQDEPPFGTHDGSEHHYMENYSGFKGWGPTAARSEEPKCIPSSLEEKPAHAESEQTRAGH